jgi:hypothetical protein
VWTGAEKRIDMKIESVSFSFPASCGKDKHERERTAAPKIHHRQVIALGVREVSGTVDALQIGHRTGTGPSQLCFLSTE